MAEMCCTRLAEYTGRKKSPFWHHRTTLSGCIFAAEARIDNRHVLIIMVNFGQLTAEIRWRVGAPQQISTAFAPWQRYSTAL